MVCQPVFAQSPSQAATGIATVLVLKNGRTLQGIVNRNSTGYVVQLPAGSLSIDDDQVLFIAADRTEAFTKARGTIDIKLADDHVKLATWCLTNSYHAEAAAELREALQIEPGHKEARMMLARLESIMNPEKPRHQQVEQSASRTIDGFDVPEVRPLGDFPREIGLEFVSKVQPILMNKCATSGCHGPNETNKLRLERVVSGANRNRLYTERNLAAVLEQIDISNPERSPLLIRPRGAHGKNGGSLFSGPGSAEQLEMLRSWVVTVASDKSTNKQAEASKTNLLKRDILIAPETPSISGAGKTENRGPKAEKRQQRSEDLLEQTLLDQRPDMFDPREFNERHHGTGRNRKTLNGN